jgi:competence protein ComEA
MVGLPLRRLLPYAAASLLVLAVGGWTLHASSSASGGDGESAFVVGSATTLSAAGRSSPAEGSAAPATGGSPNGSATTTTTRSTVFVQVAGAVRRPGVYEVDAGSRVFEVLLEAGGVSPEGDEQALPLAATVADGMRVFVPRKAEGTTGGGDRGGNTTSSAGIIVPAPAPGASSPPVSLSTATAAELDALPGIGPATAARIVAFRESNGPFKTVEELDDVPGIGPATIERLRSLVQP